MRMEKGTANSSGEGGCLFVASLRGGWTTLITPYVTYEERLWVDPGCDERGIYLPRPFG